MIIIGQRKTGGKIIDRGINGSQSAGIKVFIKKGDRIRISVAPLQRIIAGIPFHRPALVIVCEGCGIGLQVPCLPKTGLRLQSTIAE